jgi:hypothetical protein
MNITLTNGRDIQINKCGFCGKDPQSAEEIRSGEDVEIRVTCHGTTASIAINNTTTGVSPFPNLRRGPEGAPTTGPYMGGIIR